MRNIFLFIRRYFNLLLFLVLQAFCIYSLFRYNRFHEAVFSGMANAITGKINERYNDVEYYFNLKKTNEQLAKENARLYNQLRSNTESPDSTLKVFADTIVVDTLGTKRANIKYVWMEAKVVGNTISSQFNTLMLHRGANQGVKKDMVVVGPDGVVGTITDVGDNYSVVMSLLHRLHSVPVKLKSTDYSGTVKWDGVSPMYVNMNDVPKEANVKVGDTILTNNYSTRFPAEIPVGYVKEIIVDKTRGTYNLKLRTATNFYTIEYAYIVDNVQKEEQLKLEKENKKRTQLQQQ
jgi:rod shape-determining protein MreC